MQAFWRGTIAALGSRMTTRLLSTMLLVCAFTTIAFETRADDSAPRKPLAATDRPAWIVDAPKPWEPTETRFKRPGLMAGGVVLALAGVGLAVGGGVLYANSAPSGGFMDFSGLGRAGGVLMIMMGTGSVIGGSVMIGIGGREVSVSSRAASLHMQLGLSPQGVSWQGSF
jgi:hypothetical protein